MRYRLRRGEGKGEFWWTDGLGTNRFISDKPIELNAEEAAEVIGGDKRFIVEAVEEVPEPTPMPEPDGNPPASSPEDITQSAEVAERTPDTEKITRPNGGKRRRRRS
jgi:hypothetical protein